MVSFRREPILRLRQLTCTTIPNDLYPTVRVANCDINLKRRPSHSKLNQTIPLAAVRNSSHAAGLNMSICDDIASEVP